MKARATTVSAVSALQKSFFILFAHTQSLVKQMKAKLISTDAADKSTLTVEFSAGYKQSKDKRQKSIRGTILIVGKTGV